MKSRQQRGRRRKKIHQTLVEFLQRRFPSHLRGSMNSIPPIYVFDQSYLQEPAAQKILTELPVRKPGNVDFFRVHPSPDYTINLGLITLGKRQEDVYAIAPLMTACFKPTDYQVCSLSLYTNREGDLFFWPIKLPRDGGEWNSWPRSATECAQKAKTTWIRIVANQKLAVYEYHVAEGKFPEPEWPAHSLRDLLEIVFSRDRLVNNPNHEVILKLRGLL